MVLLGTRLKVRLVVRRTLLMTWSCLYFARYKFSGIFKSPERKHPSWNGSAPNATSKLHRLPSHSLYRTSSTTPENLGRNWIEYIVVLPVEKSRAPLLLSDSPVERTPGIPIFNPRFSSTELPNPSREPRRQYARIRSFPSSFSSGLHRSRSFFPPRILS